MVHRDLQATGEMKEHLDPMGTMALLVEKDHQEETETQGPQELVETVDTLVPLATLDSQDLRDLMALT